MRTVLAEDLFELLQVQLEAFAICLVGEGRGLREDPQQVAVLHFVLEGTGSIEWDGGGVALSPDMVVVIPSNLATVINGRGPVTDIVDAKDVRFEEHGIVRFEAGGTENDLVLACASVSAAVGALSLFDRLEEPLVQPRRGDTLTFLFREMLAEVSALDVGTKSMLTCLMKQVVVLLLRDHLKRRAARSPFEGLLENANVHRAMTAMVKSPQDHHTVSSLAAMAGMGVSRFTYQFGKIYGPSPMAFLQSLRLQLAARLLRETSRPIKSIAGDAGFSSRSHFSRAFRGTFGVDPTAYRNDVSASREVAEARL